MRNRILSITRSSIPYVKEIMPIAGSVTGCILMQQLDYWFERYPDGFYKFQDPAAGHPMYKVGESWTEELGFTVSEFKCAFDRIGVRHKSKSEYTASENKFGGKFYCCYTDRRMGVTYYFRDHPTMDAALDAIVTAQEIGKQGPEGSGGGQERQRNAHIPAVFAQNRAKSPANEQSAVAGANLSSVTGKALSSVPGNSLTIVTANDDCSVPANSLTLDTGNADCRDAANEQNPLGTSPLSNAPEVLKGIPQEVTKGMLAYTKTTLSNTSKALPQQPPQGATVEPKRGSRSMLEEELVFPQGTMPAEREALVKLMATCPEDCRQAVLDEVEGARAKKTLRSGVVPFARHLVTAAHTGEFSPSLGIAVLAGRETAASQRKVVDSALQGAEVKDASAFTDEEIEKIPSPGLRERMRKLKLQQSGAGR